MIDNLNVKLLKVVKQVKHKHYQKWTNKIDWISIFVAGKWSTNAQKYLIPPIQFLDEFLFTSNQKK